MASLMELPLIADKLSTYLSVLIGTPVHITKVDRVSGGLSWLTYAFEFSENMLEFQQSRRYVLRLGHPDGHLAPYSAEPEYLALKAFAGSQIPVPRVHWQSDDCSILGAPFLICEFAEGTAPLTWDYTAKKSDAGLKLSVLAQDFICHIASVHTLSWINTQFAAKFNNVNCENAARIQVNLWEERINRKALQAFPVIKDATIWLKNNCPTAQQISIVHGDYRMGNFLEKNGRISAILDWELAHIGDPDEDLGWTSARIFTMDKSQVCDLVDRQTFFQKYEECTERKIDSRKLQFYEILTIYKLVAINIGGIYSFYTRRGSNPRIGAIANQFSIHMRLLNRLVGEAQ